MSIEGYQLTVLENGFEVHSQKIPGAKKAYVEVRAKSGSNQESSSLTGVAHYLEHMFGYGSDKYDEKTFIPPMMDEGGLFNMMTGKSETFYWRCALSRKIPDFLDRVSSVLVNPSFTEIEVEKEREPILVEETGSSADTDNRVNVDLYKTIYPQHRVASPIIGERHHIEQISYDDLRAYYEANYQASNMFLVASGDVDHDYLVALAEEKFGGLPIVPPRRSVERFPYSSGTFVTGTDVGKLVIDVGFQALPLTDPRQIKEAFSSSILARKVFDELRLDKKLLYTPSTGLMNNECGDVFSISSDIDPKNIRNSLEGIIDVLRDSAQNISEGDLEALKNQQEELLADVDIDPKEVGQNMAYSLQYRGEYISFSEQTDALQSLTVDDVQGVVKRFISSEPYLVITGDIEDAPNFGEMVSDLRQELGIERQRPLGLTPQFG